MDANRFRSVYAALRSIPPLPPDKVETSAVDIFRSLLAVRRIFRNIAMIETTTAIFQVGGKETADPKPFAL